MLYYVYSGKNGVIDVKKIIFLEGLPGVGKTTIINCIQSKKMDNIRTVDEIVDYNIFENLNSSDQKNYIKNDDIKINKYNEGLIIIDRGPISTLVYNMARSELDLTFSSKEVEEWFENVKKIYDDSTEVIYLKNSDSYYTPYENVLDPYGSVENQKRLQEITLDVIKKYAKNYKIIEYKKENIEEFINENIN